MTPCLLSDDMFCLCFFWQRADKERDRLPQPVRFPFGRVVEDKRDDSRVKDTASSFLSANRFSGTLHHGGVEEQVAGPCVSLVPV